MNKRMLMRNILLGSLTIVSMSVNAQFCDVQKAAQLVGDISNIAVTNCNGEGLDLKSFGIAKDFFETFLKEDSCSSLFSDELVAYLECSVIQSAYACIGKNDPNRPLRCWILIENIN